MGHFCRLFKFTHFASAYAMAAWCHCWRKVNGWMTDRPQEIAEGIRLARRAVELDNGDAIALAGLLVRRSGVPIAESYNTAMCRKKPGKKIQWHKTFS